jgi:hypothetical protein
VTIRVERELDAVKRRMKVFLDGELMARLSPGDSVDLAGPDGVIEVRAKIDWTYSAPLKVTDPGEAEVVRVVVGFRAPWSAVLSAWSRPRAALLAGLADD